ncbi:unnamed protein product [Polarella glacialis]|nr:unnamed protein product [Polarella glacialis]
MLGSARWCLLLCLRQALAWQPWCTQTWQNCSSVRKCCDLSAACYEMDGTWATCMKTPCETGIHGKDPDPIRNRTNWTCRELLPEYGDQCRPGFVEDLTNGVKGCVRPTEPPLMTFYMYRATDWKKVPLSEGINAANAPGLMYYLHNEVAGHCPRKFGITRVIRYKVTTRATKELYADAQKNFGLFLQFDAAQCTNPRCKLMIDKYGYIPGCTENPHSIANYGPLGKWYSLPGQCPFSRFWEKNQTCREEEPGGFCKYPPTGERDCTFSIDWQGEITMDELTGIWNYDWWCKQPEHNEYDKLTDKGTWTNFWDGIHDPGKDAWRLARFKNIFAGKYPQWPSDLGEPVCDGTWFEGDKPPKIQAG